jgi:hypothetical protein
LPNWCNNRLTVLGPADRVAAFVDKAHGTGQHYKAHRTEIEWWQQRCEQAKAEGEPLLPHPDDKDMAATPLSFHQLVPIPDAVMAGPYDPGGIDAEHRLWGVKWGATEDQLVAHTPGRAEYKYDTPWDPATKFFETLSEGDWKDLLFIVSYSEEYPSRGRFALRGGHYLAEVHDRPREVEVPEGLSEVARSEWYRSWQTHHYDRHEDFVSSMRSALRFGFVAKRSVAKVAKRSVAKVAKRSVAKVAKRSVAKVAKRPVAKRPAVKKRKAARR